MDTIKANPELVIDQRPRDESAMASARVTQLFTAGSDLLPTELDALACVTSDSWLARNGLIEGADGEVLSRAGTILLPIGFLPAVRKIVNGVDRQRAGVA